MKNLPRIELPQKAVYEKIAEDIDFFALFQIIEKEHENCFLLESLADETYESRYSVIGFDPVSILTANNNILNIDGVDYQTDNPYFALRDIIPQNIISRNYAGGLIGYLSYDAAIYIESSLSLKKHQDFDHFKFGAYTDGLVYDKFTGEIFYFYYDNNRIDLVQKYLRQTKNNDPVTGNAPGVTFIEHSMTKEQHRKTVLNIIEEIKAGNTFQCEAGFKSRYHIKGDTTQIYRKLREVNPSPHMFFIKFGEQKLLGASPELLFRLRDGDIETFPLAGTIHRGKTAEEDRRLTRLLLNDPKERAEHYMLVDMHRNDVGRVSRFGTVKVRRLMDIVKFSHVQHISSEITGIIRHDKDMFDGLASLFPGGVLNGAPKVESMKIIERNEPEARGPYGGAIGHFGFNGNCTFPIPIRSLFISKENGYAQTCSGIVYDSDPDKEYNEIMNKLAAMKKTLDSFRGQTG